MNAFPSLVQTERVAVATPEKRSVAQLVGNRVWEVDPVLCEHCLGPFTSRKAPLKGLQWETLAERVFGNPRVYD